MGDRGDRVGVSGDVGVADARCATGSLAFAFFFDLRREMRLMGQPDLTLRGRTRFVLCGFPIRSEPGVL